MGYWVSSSFSKFIQLDDALCSLLFFWGQLNYRTRCGTDLLRVHGKENIPATNTNKPTHIVLARIKEFSRLGALFMFANKVMIFPVGLLYDFATLSCCGEVMYWICYNAWSSINTLT